MAKKELRMKKQSPRTAERILFATRGYKCEKCESDYNLDVHHKDGYPKNNTLKNLQILCESCHQKVHQEINKRKNKKESGYPKHIVIETDKETKERLKDVARLRRITMKELLSGLIKSFLDRKRGGIKNASQPGLQDGTSRGNLY